MKFQPRHVVTMVVAVSAAAVLAPVGVMAATGITITDPFNSSRAARVTDRGTLWVESRAGVASDSFSMLFPTVTDTAFRDVKVTTARIAVTSFAATIRGDTQTSVDYAELWAFVQTSGTAPCGGTGWSAKLLASLALNAGDSEQLLWNGPPLVLPTPPAGKRVCLRTRLGQHIGGTYVDLMVTGFTFK